MQYQVFRFDGEDLEGSSSRTAILKLEQAINRKAREGYKLHTIYPVKSTDRPPLAGIEVNLIFEKR